MTTKEFIEEWNNDKDVVGVKSSGSTGAPKEMWVEKRRMRASAQMTCDFLGLKSCNSALLCMSVDYIAGKMMVVRAVEQGMKLYAVEPSGHPLSDESLNNICLIYPCETEQTPSLQGVANIDIDLVAMVPMQVYNTLKVPEERERLKRVKHLIIGGGAIENGMEDELRDFPNAIWSSYGMTETLSHIAMRRINGEEATEWYKTLPGIEVSTTEEGCLVVDAPALCSGKLTTNDIVEMQNGKFRVIGRRDNVICSGGIKIQIEEIEATLRPYIEQEFAISKKKNERFGEIVVMVTEGGKKDEVKRICEEVLPRYWQPKEYISVSKIPKTETDKIARKKLEEMIRG